MSTQPGAALGRGGEPITLLRADPDFGTAIPTADHDIARRCVVGERHEPRRGSWAFGDPAAYGRNPRLAIVVGGFLLREVALQGRTATAILGPGDLFDPWASRESSLSYTAGWSVPRDASIAVLDERFDAAQQHWPGLAAYIQRRLAEQLERDAIHGAIRQLNRVDDRILGILLHLTDHWGTVTPSGVALGIDLTHEGLGRLVGARRPTVTLAIARLHDQGRLDRRSDGAWMLPHSVYDGQGVFGFIGERAMVGSLADAH